MINRYWFDSSFKRILEYSNLRWWWVGLIKQSNWSKQIPRWEELPDLSVKTVIQSFQPQYLFSGLTGPTSKMWSRLIKRNIDDGYFTNDFRRKSLDAVSVGSLLIRGEKTWNENRWHGASQSWLENLLQAGNSILSILSLRRRKEGIKWEDVKWETKSYLMLLEISTFELKSKNCKGWWTGRD